MGKKKVSLFTKDVLAAAGSSFSEAEMPRAHFCALGWIPHTLSLGLSSQILLILGRMMWPVGRGW